MSGDFLRQERASLDARLARDRRLADVLACLTDRPAGHWIAELASPAWRGVVRVDHGGVAWRVANDPSRASFGARFCPWARGPDVEVVAGSSLHVATLLSTGEAIEAMHTRGLWPWEPGDPRAPWWWCGYCRGRGFVHSSEVTGSELCPACANEAALRVPLALPELVAVAVHGPANLTHYVEMAELLAPGARVVWRPMTREAIAEHHARRRGDAFVGRGEMLCAAFSTCILSAKVESWDYLAPAYGPTLRAIALEDGRETDVHLVACDDARVVLAVELLGASS